MPEILWNLERFARHHHGVLNETLGIRLKPPPSDSTFRYWLLQVDGAAIRVGIHDWAIAPAPSDTADLDQLVCRGKPWAAPPARPLAEECSAAPSLRMIDSSLWRLRLIRLLQAKSGRLRTAH